MCKTLEAITVFCEQGLFNDQRLLETFTESIPFLCHPVSQCYNCTDVVKLLCLFVSMKQ